MKTPSKAQIISRLVRAVLANNGDTKLMHMGALRDLVGNANASKLLDMKVVDQNPLRTPTLAERLAIMSGSTTPKMINGKVHACIFGRYVPLFIY